MSSSRPLCSVILRLYVSLGFVFVTASPGFHFVFSVPAKRLAGKSFSERTYLGMWNFVNVSDGLAVFVSTAKKRVPDCIIIMTLIPRGLFHNRCRRTLWKIGWLRLIWKNGFTCCISFMWPSIKQQCQNNEGNWNQCPSVSLSSSTTRRLIESALVLSGFPRLLESPGI